MVARTRLIPALILLYIGGSIGSMRLAHKDAKYNVEHRGSGRDCGAVDLGCAVREDVLAKCGAGRRPVCPGTFHSRGAGEGHREGPKPWARRSGGSSRESGRTQRPIEPGTRPGSRPRSSFFARSGPGSEEVLSNNPDDHSCFQTPSEGFPEVLLSSREKSSPTTDGGGRSSKQSRSLKITRVRGIFHWHWIRRSIGGTSRRSLYMQSHTGMIIAWPIYRGEEDEGRAVAISATGR